MNLRQKLFYIPFQDDSKNANFFNKNIEFPHNVSQRNITSANRPPPNVQLEFLVGKINM